jgi:hypothetical protein
MKTRPISARSWSTSTQGHPVGSSPVDLSALGEHMEACQGGHRHLTRLHCVAQSMHGFIASRLVSSLVLVAVLFGLAYWLL